MKPLVSIITPVFNAERFLRETIESVQKQTFENWELILVDDCSKDSSSEIIRELSKNDDRLVYIRLKKNSGAAVARNTALDISKGRYIAFLDSDDKWEVNKLEKQLQFMQQNQVGFCFSAYSVISEDGEIINKKISVPNKINYNGLLKNTIIGCLTVLIDKNIIGEFRMPLVRAGQDTATWLSILRKGHNAYGINEPLAKYRIVTGSISSNKLNAIKRTWNTYRNIEKIPLLKSFYYLTFYILNAVIKRIFKVN